jgi:hypothetical protein
LLLCSASLLGCRTPPDDGTVLGNDFAQSAPDQSTAPDMAHLFGGGAIGDPCTAGGDCMSGYCETRGFPGGYCTIVVAECPAPGGTQNVCPAGSACEMILVGEDLSADLCIKTCGTTGGTCRTGGGYSCCTLFQMSELCLPSNLCAR